MPKSKTANGEADTSLLVTIPEFCHRAKISRAFLYLLWKRKQGPKSTKVGRRRMIAVKAAEKWVRERQRDT